MKTIHPIPFIIIAMLAIVLPQGDSAAVSAEAYCVMPLASVTIEGSWNGDCPSRNREDTYARFYTFSLLQQSEVSITLESETDPYVFLLSGSGVDADYLAENDDIAAHGQDLNSRIEMNLPPGEYTIEATTYEQNATGDFTLTVKGVGPLEDRTALVAPGSHTQSLCGRQHQGEKYTPRMRLASEVVYAQTVVILDAAGSPTLGSARLSQIPV